MSGVRELDTRIVYGARCTWWAGISDVATFPGSPEYEPRSRIPCCPHCGSPLFEMQNEGEWFAGVERYQAAGHPGYRVMIEWARGKCFPNMAAMEAAYATHTGAA